MNEEFKRVISEFNKKDLTVVKIVDYDPTKFIVMALHDVKRPDEIDCWYGYDRQKNRILTFSPLSDLKKFSKVTKENVVYTKGK